MKKIIYLPLDERPCNYSFPLEIARENEEIELIAPKKEILGKKKIPANFNGIKEFLLSNVKDAYGAIISCDMLLYGGIVPSRLHHLNVEEILSRLDVLDEMKSINPNLKLYCSCLVMRCPVYSSSDEEPDYYALCGEEIHYTGEIVHKRKEGVISEEEYVEKMEAFSKKTKGYLEDYLERREKNLKSVLGVLKKTKTVIDYLVIPQDDSAPYGYTAMDQAIIHKYMDDNSIEGVKIYPGADEVGMTLLSRMVSDLKGKHFKVFVSYPEDENRNIIPLWEDRELYKTMNSQITSAGLIETDNYNDADIVLFYNVAREQIEITEYRDEDFDYYVKTGYLDKIDSAFYGGKAVVIADKRYANGGDLSLMKYVYENHGVLGLAGYAGWNTSSNTLGTAICMSNFYMNFGRTASHDEFLVERLIEDIGYCAFSRWKVTKEDLPKLKTSYSDLSGNLEKSEECIKDDLNLFLKNNFETLYNEFCITKCYSPWKRMFEVGLEVRKK